MKVAALVVLIVAVSGLEVTAGVVRRQVPEGASSDGGQVPEDASSDGGQVPEDASSDGGQVPEGASSDGGQVLEGASSDGGQVPEGASSDGGQVPEGASSDGGQVPEGALSDQEQQGLWIFSVKTDVKKPSVWIHLVDTIFELVPLDPQVAERLRDTLSQSEIPK
ncbi:uncharacterized protein O3C94_010944 [Discoglossus pictus]